MGVLRLLLALSVVTVHSSAIFGSYFVGGEIAVQSFFIISGFYMSLILSEKYIGKNNSYRLFLSSRFLRLFPIYWVILLATIVVSIGVIVTTHGHTIPKFDSYLTTKTNFFSFTFLVLSNLFIFGQDAVMFLGINPETGYFFFASNFRLTNPPLWSFLFIPTAWTLGIELTFYLIAPFILRKGFVVIIIGIILSLAVRAYLYYHLHYYDDPWSYRFFPSELALFLLGNISYRIFKVIENRNISNIATKVILAALVILTVCYDIIPATFISSFPKRVIYYLLIVSSIPFLFKFSKHNRLDMKIGELSYPVYISHILIITIIHSFHVSILNSGIIIAIITVVVSMLLNKFIANPIERYRQGRITRNLLAKS